MINLENVSFSYDKKEVLKNISTQLSKGELTFIIGPNGSGKSTLLSLIGRLLSPTEGNLYVDEKDYASFSSKQFARTVSTLTQERKTPDISVYEYIAYGRYPHLGFLSGFSSLDKEAVENAMAITSTKEFSHRNLSSLSGGEKQRVYLAMLLCQDTPYILLDEPTTFLDISHSFEIMELLEKLKKMGKGIIAVVHDIALVLKYADRILLLSDGKLVLDTSPDEMVQSKELENTLNIKCKKAIIDGDEQYFFSTRDVAK